jgi:hypothetical protein
MLDPDPDPYTGRHGEQVSKVHIAASQSVPVPFFPEMVVTEITLAKICRFCQLSSHSRGFFARV